MHAIITIKAVREALERAEQLGAADIEEACTVAAQALGIPVEAVPVATVKENPHCPEGTSDELDRYLPGRRAWEPAAFNAVATAPDHIWLDIGDDPEMREWDFSKLEGVTWSEDNATGYGVRYIRADLAPPPAASLREQEDAVRYRVISDDALAEEMANAQCDEGEESWRYLGRDDRAQWIAAAKRAKELLKGGM